MFIKKIEEVHQKIQKGSESDKVSNLSQSYDEADVERDILMQELNI